MNASSQDRALQSEAPSELLGVIPQNCARKEATTKYIEDKRPRERDTEKAERAEYRNIEVLIYTQSFTDVCDTHAYVYTYYTLPP